MNNKLWLFHPSAFHAALAKINQDKKKNDKRKWKSQVLVCVNN